MSTSGVNSSVSSLAPWRKGVAWYVVLIQGLVLLAIGGAALWQTDLAIDVILIGVGVWLFAAAIWTLIQAVRGREYGMSVFGLLAAGGGLVVGLSLLVPYLFLPTLDDNTVLIQVGIGLLAIGLLTLLSTFVEKPESGFPIMTLVRSLLQLVLGGYILYAVATQTVDLVRWIAIAALVVGALLAAYSIWLFLSQRPQTTPAAP